MSSETEPIIPNMLVASTVLIGSVSGLLALLGTVLRIAKFANWELFLQVGFIGLTLSFVVGVGMGIVWAVRALGRSDWAQKEGVARAADPNASGPE